LKTTISSPTSLSQTRKLVVEKTKQSQEASKAIIQEEIETKPVGNSLTLSQELFDTQLERIRAHFKNANKNLELAILDQQIKVKEGGEVVLEVAGHMQEEIAGKMKPELIGLIRQLTGADRVLISVEFKEEVESDVPKLYTNSDKLNHLLKKHGALADLQRRFGLEVDF